MANPTMSKKKNESKSLTKNAKSLFRVIFKDQNKEEVKNDEIAMIKVSDLISKMSFYYEKIRNTVDDKEEHLLRKNAIERILRRQIVIEGAIPVRNVKGPDVAKHLLIELIRAAYLDNDKVPETRIKEIGIIIDKYLYLRKSITSEMESDDILEKNEITRWVIAIAASDIEERLGGNKVDDAVVDYMYDTLLDSIKLKKESSHKKDREIQIYVGIYRNFLKFDQDMLNFVVFKYFIANWNKAGKTEVERVAKDFVHLKKAIDAQVNHSLQGPMNKVISRYTVFFSILIDVIADDPEGSYASIKNDSKAFDRQIRKICDRRYKQAKSKLWRAAVRSIIYIFITKSIFAVAVEVPATKFFGEPIDWFSLGINVSFPAALLFVIVLFTKMPSDKNTEKITEGISEVIFEEEKRDKPFTVKAIKKRKGFGNTIFGLVYAVTFFTSFGFVFWALDKINFNWVSMILFVFFLAFVSFFAVRIRKNAKELMIIEQKENILTFVAEFFYIPIVSAGKFMSERFSKVNVFIFILDFIIEAPFKVFVEITEDWARYVKERRDELV